MEQRETKKTDEPARIQFASRALFRPICLLFFPEFVL
jgi:hypothetical protein